MASSRKRKKGTSKDELRANRQPRIQSMLAAWGVPEAVRKSRLVRPILESQAPRPTITLGEGTQDTPNVRRILKMLRYALSQVRTEFPGLADKVSFVDLKSVVLPAAAETLALFQPLRDLAPPPESSVTRALVACLQRLRPEDITEALRQALRVALGCMARILAMCNRVDVGLYYVRPVQTGRGEGLRTTFELHAEPARTRTIEVGGRARPAYQVGGAMLDYVEWVTWPRSLFQETDDGPPLPVYVQGHALDRLYRRPDVARALPKPEWAWQVHDGLRWSLGEPRMRPMPGQPGKRLVEFHCFGRKLGYLVVNRVGDVVLAETFLFLTMDGTPEGDALWRELRLRRADKEYVGLDSLRTFVQTDVRQDPELVELLDRAGCGELCRGIDVVAPERYDRGHAEMLRKHLGLPLDDTDEGK